MWGWHNLDIERVSVELILALELLAVSLVHSQLVLSPLKHLDLVGHLHPTPCEVSLPGDCHCGLRALLQLHHLLHVRVVVNDIWQPEVGDLLIGERVQRRLELQVVEQSSNLGPFQYNPKLELDLMVDLLDLDDLHEDD